MRNRSLVAVAALSLVLLFACASGGSEEEQQPAAAPADAGPKAEEAVKAFYEHLNAGRTAEALALYTEANRAALEAPDSGFGEWAQAETRGGTIQAVEVPEVTTPGDTVTVPFTVVYRDGSRASRSVDAYRISGAWQLGTIAEPGT
jgi:hypothetical protein